MDTEFNYFGDQDDVELEDIIERRGDEEEENEDEDRRGDGEDEAIEVGAPKKKNDTGDNNTKKRVMVPRPKLDAARLGSARGMLALEADMRGVKLRGRGHELADLDLVMGRLQHWAHRLFPSYTFDDCLDKLEKLGFKKLVAVQVKRIRMGLSSVDDVMDTTLRGDELVPDDDDDDDDVPPARPAAVDPDAAFNDVVATARPTVKPILAPARFTFNTELSEEQKARILRNRLAAEERKLARLKERQQREEEAALANITDADQENP